MHRNMHIQDVFTTVGIYTITDSFIYMVFFNEVLFCSYSLHDCNCNCNCN